MMMMTRTTGAVLLATACSLGGGTTETAGSASIQDVHFESEGVTLAGTLWLPDGPGPHPAVVFVHGSGRASRRSAIGVATDLNRLGLAVLGYDKRGVGASDGEYVGRNNGSVQNLTLLARDAAAGVAMLRTHPSIDPDRIGLWGVSQAGWIVPAAAVFDGRVAFTVLISGPTVTVGEENYYSELTGDNSGTRATLSQQELSRLLAERGPYGFDPQPYLRQLSTPGLWLLGSADESIPIPETVAILDRLIESYSKPFMYHVWAGADHGLRVNGRVVEDLLSVQENFLFDVVGLPQG